MARGPHAGEKGTGKRTIQTKRPPQTPGSSSHSSLSGATFQSSHPGWLLWVLPLCDLSFYLLRTDPAPKQFASTWIHKCATGKSSRAATFRGKVHSLKELLYMFSTSVPTKLPKIKVIFCSNIPQGPCFLTYCQNYFHMCCCTMARFSTREETNYYD